MRILVTNDDGIHAPGIRRLIKSLSSHGYEVYVAAPKEPMSGMGKSLKMRAHYGAIDIPGTVKAWWVDSTPATSVYLALYYLLDEKPDVVVSGINRGPNIGLEDILTSGTVGAAIEAALNGVPGLAVSLATDSGHHMEEYSLAAEVTAELLPRLSELEPGELVNLNVPERPKGIMATTIAWNNYKVKLTGSSGYVQPVAHSFRDRYWDRVEGSDVWAVMNDYVSFTLIDLKRLRTNGANLSKAERLVKGLDEKLKFMREGLLHSSSSTSG